jgi:hypothetical protein
VPSCGIFLPLLPGGDRRLVWPSLLRLLDDGVNSRRRYGLGS